MKKIYKKLLTSIKKRFFDYDKFLCKSYSQQGEDRILATLFSQPKGFYVDVGAHHPKHFSNTRIFYCAGWSGINIDAVPGMKELFSKDRPRDINLEIGVGLKREELTYHIFNEPALNSFSPRVAAGLKDHLYFKNTDQKKITVMPLAEILDQYLPLGTVIDFLSVDVEGLDYEVLQSNNWDKYRPKVVVCEVPLGSSTKINAVLDSDIYKFLQNKGYELVAKTTVTLFFMSSTAEK